MIVIYNTNYILNSNSYLTLAIARSLKAIAGSDRVIVADNSTLLPLAASGYYDSLICIDGQRLRRDILQRARKGFRRVVLWTFEDPFAQDANAHNADLFDKVFTNDPGSVSIYGEKGHYLPLGANESLHFRDIRADSELEYDIFFAGTMWPNRVPIVSRLIEAFPEARFKLVCPTNEYLPPIPPALAERCLVRPINHESFIDFANRSRVTLTLFRDYASSGEVSQATAPGPRLFELGYAGTAQVVEMLPQMDKQHFSGLSGLDLVTSPDELVNSVSRLLSDANARRASATAIQTLVHERHTYEKRLLELISVGLQGPDLDVTRTVATQSRRTRVLMCTHSTLDNLVWGGIEVYQESLRIVLARQVEIFFWTRRETHCQLLDQAGKLVEQFDVDPIGWLDILADGTEEMAFSQVLSTYSIDVVHIQHLGHHAASLPIIAKSAGCGVVFSAHDFFLVCSRYNLLDFEQKFCNIGHRAISACDVCLKISEGLPPGVQEQRRLFFERVLESVDILLFGTNFSKELITNIYPQIRYKRLMVLSIPLPASSIGGLASAMKRGGARRSKDKLKIAVVGNFIRTKGADTVINIIQLANPALYEFHIFGDVEAQYSPVLNALGPNVVAHGRHRPGDLALLEMEVAFHLSTWPETYCITLSEAWQAGLIPIVSNIGALHDRVTDGVDGFKVNVGDAGAILEILDMLRSDKALRHRIRGNIGPHLWQEAGEHARKILEIYREVAPRRKLDETKLAIDLGQLHLLPTRTWKELPAPRHIFDPPRTNQLETMLPHRIADWLAIQGSEFYCDEVCGVTDFAFGADYLPAQELTLRGWGFVPDVGVVGRAYLCLVRPSTETVIFVAAEREVREDVIRIFKDAPLRTGFYAKAKIAGKWTDGEFVVAYVSLMGDRAAFQLSNVELTIYDGQVVNLRRRFPSNEDVGKCFAIVKSAIYDPLALTNSIATVSSRLQQGVLDGPTSIGELSHVEWITDAVLHFEVDACCERRVEAMSYVAVSSELFTLSGWIYASGGIQSGTVYISLVGRSAAGEITLSSERTLRADVHQAFPAAPIDSGFSFRGHLPPGVSDDTYDIALILLVDGAALVQPLKLSVQIKSQIVCALVCNGGTSTAEPSPATSTEVASHIGEQIEDSLAEENPDQNLRVLPRNARTARARSRRVKP